MVSTRQGEIEFFALTFEILIATTCTRFTRLFEMSILIGKEASRVPWLFAKDSFRFLEMVRCQLLFWDWLFFTRPQVGADIFFISNLAINQVGRARKYRISWESRFSEATRPTWSPATTLWLTKICRGCSSTISPTSYDAGECPSAISLYIIKRFNRRGHIGSAIFYSQIFNLGLKLVTNKASD